MSVLFGHPTGNPNSHYAALAHFEAGRLEAFCVPWMPRPTTLRALGSIRGLGAAATRLHRRYFEPLKDAPLVQGRAGELVRLTKRFCAPRRYGDERLAYAANDWLMKTMRRECRRNAVTAVHAYEDCSLWQFEEAKRRGKACIYDMPIGYYPAWEETQAKLVRQYADWLPPGGLTASRYARPEQKRREMELADLVLAPSAFVENSIREFCPDKKLARASYGVDLEFWRPRVGARPSGPLRFLYAGQLGIRKGIPVLLEAWRRAALPDAQLDLVGLWTLAPERRATLPPNVTHHGPCSRNELRARYQSADVFVFPSFFEGFGLVVLEAMACGLPVVVSEVLEGMGLVTENSGVVVKAGEVEQLTEALRRVAAQPERLPELSRAARAAVERFTWDNYRRGVSDAVSAFV